MQKRTSWIITKMYRSILLYSLLSTHWSCCRLCYPLSKCSSNPKIATWSLSGKILILRPIHCSWQKFLLNHSCAHICSSPLPRYAYTFVHHTIISRLYFHPHIFAFKLAYWIIIHLCVLRKDFTIFESWEASKIHR